MKLKAITYKEYKELPVELQGAYNFAFHYSHECEAKDTINFGKLHKKTFGEVKDIQETIRNSDATKNDLFETIYCFFEKYFVTLNVFDYCAFFYYIVQEVESICKIESVALNVELDQVSTEAGVEVFEKFGALLQIDKLAGGDVTKYDTIRSMPYEYCLTKLALNATEYNYNKRRNEIIAANAKLRHN
jgi:hypothetical protein